MTYRTLIANSFYTPPHKSKLWLENQEHEVKEIDLKETVEDALTNSIRVLFEVEGPG